MSNQQTVIGPNETRVLGIYFNRKTAPADPVNPSVDNITTDTTFAVSHVSIIAILGTVAALFGSLQYLGSFLSGLVVPSSESNTTSTPSADSDERTFFAIVYKNYSSTSVNLTPAFTELRKFNWRNDMVELNPTFGFVSTLNKDQTSTLEDFRQNKLPQLDLLTQQTLLMLDRTYGTKDGPTSKVLSSLYATDVGDHTGSGSSGDDQSAAWAKGLFNRITTGGPNGSMAGKIAVNFMNTVPVAAAFDFTKRKPASISLDDPANPIVQILKDAVTSAAESAAQGLADYLKTLRKPSTESDQTDDDRQVATVVKGIKDSMPSTGRTVAQLAVFNALGNKNMADLPRAQQLRVAYTVANATRSAVEATGNHVADLYQTNSIPNESELVAVGARSLVDFLKSVGTTVANGVLQAAPVVLNAVVNSSSANNALGSTLPPDFAMTATGVHELDTPTKIILASRIVNGTPNADAGVVADKAVSDLADRQSNLGAQATLDTFTNTPTTSGLVRDSEPTQEQRDKFRNIALEVANISPTFSNVTDIGATNLVTDTALKHADSLRQSTLEMGIRSCANMIADHQSAEILYKVHLYRLKNGLEVQPRSFTDFLKTAVPIAANIAKVAAPALLALL